MTTKNDALLAAVETLEKALAEDVPGRERDWAGRVDQALAGTEQAVRQRSRALESPGGGLVGIDRPRLPSPTVTRRAAELRRELDGFAEETRALRARVQGAAQAFGVTANPANLAGALPVAPEAGAVPDFGIFRERTRKLLEALKHYEDEEARLILESVNTDIGAGD